MYSAKLLCNIFLQFTVAILFHLITEIIPIAIFNLSRTVDAPGFRTQNLDWIVGTGLMEKVIENPKDVGRSDITGHI